MPERESGKVLPFQRYALHDHAMQVRRKMRRQLPQRNVRAHRDVRGQGAVRGFCPDRSGTCYAS